MSSLDIPKDSFLRKLLLGITRPGTTATAVFTNGLLVPADEAQVNPPATNETTLTAIVTSAVGVIKTWVFQAYIPRNMRIGGRMRAYAFFDVTTGAGGACVGRLNLTVKKSGVAISGVTPYNSPNINLNATTDNKFNNMIVDVPEILFKAGDTLDVVVELEVTTALAGDPTAVVVLYHNPVPTMALLTSPATTLTDIVEKVTYPNAFAVKFDF